MPEEEEKSSGKGILIIGSLIIGGIILALILKPKPAQSSSPPMPSSLITIQQMQQRIDQLQQQIIATTPVSKSQNCSICGYVTEHMVQEMDQNTGQVKSFRCLSCGTISGPHQILPLVPRGGPDSEGFGFPFPTEGQSSSPASRNLFQFKDGSVTDADTMGVEKYKNKESWLIKRDSEGAITGIDVERNASVGSSNNAASS